MRSIITSLPCQDAYDSTVTINGLAGQTIDQLSIKAGKDAGQEYLLQVLNSDGLRIKQLTIVGEPDDTTKESWMKTVASGFTSLSKNVVIDHLVVTDVHVGMSLRAAGCQVKNLSVMRCSGDAWQIAADRCILKNWEVTNLLEVFPYRLQHSDVGQLFTKTVGDNLVGVHVSDGRLKKGGHKWEHQGPQGILSTDCVPIGCSIKRVELPGVHQQHGISLYKAVDCLIETVQTNGTVTTPGGSGNTIAGVTPIIEAGPMLDVPSKKLTPMQYAQMETGQAELDGTSQNNPRIVEYFKTTTYPATTDETPWCAAFMCWCHEMASKPHPRSAAAMRWTEWGVKIDKPEYGCVMIADYDNGRGHVGFFIGEDDTHYSILGGNQSDKVNTMRWKKTNATRWHFRKAKTATNSTINKGAAATGGTGALVAGVGGYGTLEPMIKEYLDPADSGTPVETPPEIVIDGAPLSCESIASQCPSTFEVPVGMKLISQDMYYGLLACGAAMIYVGVITYKERMKKLNGDGS